MSDTRNILTVVRDDADDTRRAVCQNPLAHECRDRPRPPRAPGFLVMSSRRPPPPLVPAVASSAFRSKSSSDANAQGRRTFVHPHIPKFRAAPSLVVVVSSVSSSLDAGGVLHRMNHARLKSHTQRADHSLPARWETTTAVADSAAVVQRRWVARRRPSHRVASHHTSLVSLSCSSSHLRVRILSDKYTAASSTCGVERKNVEGGGRKKTDAFTCRTRR